MTKNKPVNYLKEFAYEKKDKKQKNKLPNKIFLISIILVGLAILVFFANLFSGLITPGRINLNRGERYSLEHNLYSVELANTNNIGEANEISVNFKQQLAAGYVVNDKGNYHILASMYQNKSNAESVVQNLKDSGVDASIYEIKIPAIYLDLALENSEKEELKNVLTLWYDTYENLYNISISLDKSEITKEQCSIEIINLKNDLQSKIATFNESLEVAKLTQVIYTKIYANMLLEKINELVEQDNLSTLYSSKIKETYFKIIYDYISLKTELAKN